MSDVVLRIDNISKQYRLGQISTGSLAHDLNRWWKLLRGKEDPYLQVGQVNDRSVASDSEYVWSLKNVSFDVKRGDVVGIIGKNGAGKSTLLKILSQVTSPTQGSVKIKGRVAALLEVGTGFHPDLTGRENVFLNGAILGMTSAEIKSKFDEIINFSGVEKYIDTPVKRYSSGMMVRLGFAVAAHLEPEILIVDEVLAVGDAEFQKKCLGKIQNVSSEGRTVLFVSHNMQALQAICKRGILLKHGMVEENSDIDVCIQKYTGLFQEANLENLAINDRLGRTNSNGNALFTSVSPRTGNQHSWSFDSKDDVYLDFTLNIREHCDGLSFYFALIEPLAMSVITNYKTRMTEHSPKVGEPFHFSLKIPKNSLRVGQYLMYIAIGDKDLRKWYDVIDNNINLPALSITSSELDPHHNMGLVSLPFELKIEN
ncbi:ABC transporter ATP-binding protein [Leptospira meyeri]|uniref:ABC transporter ATP-binding protein n=1 Tax=Leptospira meyeri TaxID=29508 RepID=UPI000C2B4593|nr:ABC transporter ATP-binding protein [Leptospira meyeri]PJZ79411.1 ABC transporter ATP-binding protein [Leptospira meyeri]PJZ98531.1 ABC transporter ATP-binding protein [Leptospira meyeri]PKA14111.1 ABC transporter ATP-binding protein [Leptospira meyeri]TGM20822.1 ABC transporter ATP-binding protein [Leptospira meyeri]TGM71584.1 ABC transporter ATP-binding protein [Leptospira meyeri]